MTLISYAQNYEDVMLWRALKHVAHGFYIDVGAAWPDQDSVTKLFFDAGWSGMNIEPNPDLIQCYNIQRPHDINLELALSDTPGTQTMGFIDKTGLSSLENHVIQAHSKHGYAIQEKVVQIKTLLSVCQEYAANRDIHFLKVDVEGYERHVLLGNDWQRVRPWIVVVEATVPLQQVENHHEWEFILLSANYQFVYADGLNRFYVAQERPELFSAFKYPPNFFDGFVLPQQVKYQEVVDELAAIKGQLTGLEAHLVDVHASLSWRVTYPLRLIKKCLSQDMPSAITSSPAFIKKSVKQLMLFIFYAIYATLSGFPRLQNKFLSLLARHPHIKQQVISFRGQALIFPFIPTTPNDLSLDARAIHQSIQDEIKKNKLKNIQGERT